MAEGRDQSKSQKRIRTDLSYYHHIYRRELPPLDLNEQEFRFKIFRPAPHADFDISGLVESCEWRDEGNQDNLNAIPVLRGTMTLRKPHQTDPASEVVIRDGHEVRCQVSWGGRWREVWKMRVQTTTTAVADGSLTLELGDDLVLLSKSRFSYSFKQGNREHGRRYWEVIREVARRSHFDLDKQMPKGDLWIKNFVEKEISPLEAVRQVVQKEEDFTGRPHIIFWRDDKLHIKRLRRNPLLYEIAAQIRSADVTLGRRAQAFTAATGSGSGKHKSSRTGKMVTRKFTHREAIKDAVQRYGYIHANIDIGSGIDSHREARDKVRRKIAKAIRPNRVIENLSHTGIAFVRRGDAVHVRIPEEGILKGKSILFVTSVTHSLSAGDYTMSLDVTLNDPLDPNDLREAREEATRARKRNQKGKDSSPRAHTGGTG